MVYIFGHIFEQFLSIISRKYFIKNHILISNNYILLDPLRFGNSPKYKRDGNVIRTNYFIHCLFDKKKYLLFPTRFLRRYTSLAFIYSTVYRGSTQIYAFRDWPLFFINNSLTKPKRNERKVFAKRNVARNFLQKSPFNKCSTIFGTFVCIYT